MVFSNAEPWRVSKKRWWKPGRLTEGGKLPKRFPDRDELIQAGKSLDFIANQCHLNNTLSILQYIQRTGQYRVWKERRYKTRIRLALRGVPLVVIVEKEGLTSTTGILNWLRKWDLYEKWKEGRFQKRNKLADSLVERVDLSLEEIGKMCGWKGRAAAWDYYKRTDQLPIRRIYRYCYLLSIGKQPFSSKLRQELPDIVEMAQIQAYSNASEAEKRTYEFLISYPHSSKFTYESVLGVVTRCIDAKTKGEKPSRAELGGGVITPWQVGNILKFFNWKQFYKTPERLSSEQKKTLQRVFPLPVSASDIASFMDLTYQGVSKNLSEIGKRPFSEKLVSYLGPIRTNRLASEIYYALDSGLSVDEAVQYYKTTPKRVDYAREHRQTMESRIIQILRAIYPLREIKKPYLEELL